MKQPNILLLMCDQFRGDAFSFKGHPDVLTPNLDTLAELGHNFDYMYSATPSCIPARVSLFTGKKASNHKRVGYQDGIVWDYEKMLPQLLSDLGYQTQCVGKLHVHPARNNVGFNHVLLHDGYLNYYRDSNKPYHEHQEVHDDYLRFLKREKGVDADVTQTGIDPNAWVSRPWPYEEYTHPTNWVTTESINFLKKRNRDKPFFLMASYVRPHQPFDAPQAFFDLYDEDKLNLPHVGDWAKQSNTFIKNSIYGTHHLRFKQLAMKGYYACITHVDHQIGRLLMALEEDQSLEDTLVVFLSDHGELLFDHHLYRKVFPYQGSINVPLIFRVGNKISETKPTNHKSLVELRDILPTLVDFAGGEIPKDVDGVSLKNTILTNNEIERNYLHGEHSFHSQLSNQFIVTKTDKYVWYSETGNEQYFDLINDPNELVNIVDNPVFKERIDDLRNKLIKELSNRQEGFVSNNNLRIINEPVDTLD